MDPSGPLKRGRPAFVTSVEYVNAILKYKEKVVQNNKVVPRSDPVWSNIALELGGRVKSSSAYAIAKSDRYGVLGKLCDKELNEDGDVSVDISSDDEVLSNKRSSDEEINFTVTFEKSEFQKLISRRTNIVQKSTNKYFRTYTILQQHKWTEVMAKKVYDEIKLQHGFHFKKHYIFRDETSGSCVGKY